MELYYIASLVLTILLIIAFFRLSKNVSSIKHTLELERNQDAKIEYFINRTREDNHAAHRKLLYIIYSQLLIEGMTSTERRTKFEEFKIKYEKQFTELGYNYPNYPF